MSDGGNSKCKGPEMGDIQSLLRKQRSPVFGVEKYGREWGKTRLAPDDMGLL